MYKYCILLAITLACSLTTTVNACDWWGSRYCVNSPPTVGSVLIYNIPSVYPVTYVHMPAYVVQPQYLVTPAPVSYTTFWVPATQTTVSTQVVYRPYSVYKY